MIVNLIKNNQIFAFTLPKKISGQYMITDFSNQYNTIAIIDAKNEQWVLKAYKNIKIVDFEGKSFDEFIVSDSTFLYVFDEQTNEKMLIFVESLDSTKQNFSKIIIKDSGIFSIGRDENNSFCFKNRFVSSKHAKLSFDGEAWSIADQHSKNGTFVNGNRVNTCNLLPGDIIFIMGLRIIIGDKFFAINNPDEKLVIHSDSLELLRIPKKININSEAEYNDNLYFSRSPRFHREIVNQEIKIDPPPQAEKMDSVPMAFMLGPSMTMGFTSLSTGLISLTNILSNGNGDITSALPTLMMSVGMLCGTVLWPILTKKYEKKQKIKNEKKRHSKYLAYLSEISVKFKTLAKEQSDILHENIISYSECADRIIGRKANLWEREIIQKDFLNIRLGLGNIPILADIKYQEKKFTMDDDTLQNAMLSLAEGPKILQNVPIDFSVTNNIAVGVYGDRKDVKNFVASTILQMIALHSYDELKIMIFADKEDDYFNFVKNIPHFWSNDKSIRFFSNSMEDTKELSTYLEKNVEIREDSDRFKYSEHLPYYVCFFVGEKSKKQCDSLNRLIKYNNNVGFTSVFVGKSFSDFPKETKSIIHVNGDKSRLYDKDNTTGAERTFKFEEIDEKQLYSLSESIANIQLELNEKSFSLPTMITFLEMFNVGKVEQLNSLSRWNENNPTKSLKTPIGMDENGELFTLDLHENYHGPHGLVAGMTGSGKSEFVITFILSLAVNYHPDEVAFILIDYKGGGLASAFENEDKGIKLPHLAGTITNLDGASINRSLISIQSELRRRQSIFNKVLRISNEGTMDIYKYQQLYRDEIVKEPLPHLFIISDEFAELKKQQPEFMDQLISAARIGRSLGVHLILATQKPSGVVDDQIWSNSKFRVCLKVQEKSDSQEMIKCPDAAELIQTGRFYLQVGYNEFFALGQSAWCGANYYPTDKIEKSVDLSIEVVDNVGKPVLNISPSKKKNVLSSSGKQIVNVVKYLSDLAESEGIVERTLWLPPISDKIYVDELAKKYGDNSKNTYLNPIIGEYDDPFNQMQNVLTLPISDDGNCLVYGSSGSGKTTFLTTLCYSLIKKHKPEELNIYIADFGSETLKCFEKAPQVGGFITSSDDEKMVNLMKLLYREMENRRKIFSDFGGDYLNYCKNSGNIVPNIVVIINNYSAFSEQYENLQDVFSLLSRDGIRYGIYFVVSVSNTNVVRYRVQQNFKTMITLQLNDPSEYCMIVGKTNGITPSGFKGRGLICLDNVYEFQTAYCHKCDDIQKHIIDFCNKLNEKSKAFAKRIPILPEVVDYEFVENEVVDLSRIPVGVEKSSMNISTFNLKSNVVMPVLSNDISESVLFTKELIKVLSKINSTIIIDSEQMLNDSNVVEMAKYSQIVNSIFEEMVKRHNEYIDNGSDKKKLEAFEEKTYVIFGYKKFFDLLSKDEKDKMVLLLEKAEAIYKLHFVVAESYSKSSEMKIEPWFKKHINGSEGIWIGDGFVDQYILKVTKITSNLYEDIGNEYGYSIFKNKSTLIKLLRSKEE